MRTTTTRTIQIRRACAQAVRELRLKAGLSQEQLARDLGIDLGIWPAWSAGCTRPRFYTIARLLPGLHITFVEFCRTFERILKQSQPRSKKRQALPSPRLAVARIDSRGFPGP
jgi:transcriptional regulator with XRE-family HTH domain